MELPQRDYIHPKALLLLTRISCLGDLLHTALHYTCSSVSLYACFRRCRIVTMIKGTSITKGAADAGLNLVMH